MVAISPEDWETKKEVLISSIDDNFKDFDKFFEINVETLFSDDEDYGFSRNNPEMRMGLRKVTRPFVSFDDPNDDSATACPKGYYGQFSEKQISTARDWNHCLRCPQGHFDGTTTAMDKINCRRCPPGTHGILEYAQQMYNHESWDGKAYVTTDPTNFCAKCIYTKFGRFE